ncbi:MAG: hypothetical protein QXR62_06560 [Candidatus Bathyarchaeia archaeon]
MPYTTVSRVRTLTGLTATDISDVDLASLIDEADKLVESVTGRVWAGDESDYALAGFASSCFTASLAYMRLVKEEGKSEAWWKRGLEVCEKLKLSISVG